MWAVRLAGSSDSALPNADTAPVKSPLFTSAAPRFVYARVYFGIQLHGLPQFDHGGGQIGGLRERHTEPVVCVRRCRRELDGTAERLERTGTLALAHVRHAKQDVEFRIPGLSLELLLDLPCGLCDGRGVLGASHRLVRA